MTKWKFWGFTNRISDACIAFSPTGLNLLINIIPVGHKSFSLVIGIKSGDLNTYNKS
jgi:hypothetical protein